MAGMEQCVQFMESEGENGGRLQMVHFQERLKALRAKLKKMKHLRILDESVVGCDGVYDVDISKIIISTKETGISGEDLEEWLRDVYHLEMEMSGVDYVTAITTLMDTEKGLNRLQDALLKIDEEIDQKSDRYIQVVKKEDYVKKSDNFHISNRVLPKQSSMTIHEAWNHRKKSVLIEESVGQISGEYIYVYPPGIPLVVPGEVIDQDVVDTVVRYKENGLSIQGLKDYSAEIIDVVNC